MFYQKESKEIESDFDLLRRVIEDFMESFDGFKNEFQYDFLYSHLDNILTDDVVGFHQHYTSFFFDTTEYRADFIDTNFLIAMANMPFLFAKDTYNNFYLRQELHDKFYELYKKKHKFTAPVYSKLSYKDLLQRPEWKERRREIIEINGFKCSRCESNKNLQVHHKRYKKGAYPWDYDNEDLECICRDCHYTHHVIEKNAADLDSDLFKLHIPDDIKSRIQAKIEVISYVMQNFDDKFILLMASEGENYENNRQRYIITFKHLRKRKMITHEMILRYISLKNFPGVSYKSNTLRFEKTTHHSTKTDK